jgi:hypothetical protein
MDRGSTARRGSVRTNERAGLEPLAGLQDVLAGPSATEYDVRRLIEWADARVRALDARIEAGEGRLETLVDDTASPLTAVARELRRLRTLRPGLEEARAQLDALELRARSLRTRRLIEQAAGRS